MTSDQSNALFAPIYTVVGNSNFLNNLGGTENIEIELSPIRNFSLDSFEEDSESINEINSSNSFNSNLLFIDRDPIPHFNEVNHIINPSINSNNQSDSTNSLTKSESNSILFKEENLLGKKRTKEQKPRKEKEDNMRTKIKRAFFNIFLYEILDKELKNIGSKRYFEKFPNKFASDATKKRNKGIVNMTLREIFETKELYMDENEKGLFNFSQNLKIIQSEEVKKNEKFQKLLNKTFGELYIEYLDEFKINEKNRLKQKNESDDYLKEYLQLLESLIDFFSPKDY